MQTIVTNASGAVLSNPRGAVVEGSEATDEQSVSATLKNRTRSASIFCEIAPAQGGQVTVATGFEWEPADGPLDVILEPGEALYMRTQNAGTDQTVHVLKGGR